MISSVSLFPWLTLPSVRLSVGRSDGRHKCHTYVSSVFGQTRVMGVRDERVSAARANVDMNDDGRPVASVGGRGRIHGPSAITFRFLRCDGVLAKSRPLDAVLGLRVLVIPQRWKAGPHFIAFIEQLWLCVHDLQICVFARRSICLVAAAA